MMCLYIPIACRAAIHCLVVNGSHDPVAPKAVCDIAIQMYIQ